MVNLRFKLKDGLRFQNLLSLIFFEVIGWSKFSVKVRLVQLCALKINLLLQVKCKFAQMSSFQSWFSCHYS